MKTILSILVFVYTSLAFAVTIEFPEDELARESVLPVFDNAVAVKSRLVPTAGRVEVGVGAGYALNEAFFNTQRFGGHLAYNITETHGIVIAGQFYADGLGDNGKALAGTDLSSGASVETFVRMQYAPQPKYHILANYQITPYYGKISVFKDFVMNLSLYGLFGVGAIDVGGETSPAFNIGIGQKFYFSKRWGIRADLGMMMYEGVDFFTRANGQVGSPLEDTSTTSTDDVTSQVPISEFGRQTNFDLHFSLALIILI